MSQNNSNCEFCNPDKPEMDIQEFIHKLPGSLNSKVLIMYEPHQEHIEEASLLFSDDYSRDLYKKEILYSLYSDIYNIELLNSHLGLMTPSEFEKIKKKTHTSEYFKDSFINKFFDEAESLFPGITQWLKTTNYYLEQYRYNDIVKIESGDVALDIGGCIGDTSLYFIKNGASSVYTFEIDRNNLKFMRNIFSKLSIPNINIIDKAISNKRATLWYKPCKRNIGAGTISDKFRMGSYKVDVTTVDHFCEENSIHPNLIKMDIEGAEFDALRGSEETIKKYKPKLAICVYHSFHDRYLIPLLIHSILPEYKMYLKKSSPWYETVLFCTV